MKKSKKTSGVIKLKGYCYDCDEKWEGGQTAMQAIRHHEATGHHIRVEQSIWWERQTVEAAAKPKPGGASKPKLVNKTT